MYVSFLAASLIDAAIYLQEPKSLPSLNDMVCSVVAIGVIPIMGILKRVVLLPAVQEEDVMRVSITIAVALLLTTTEVEASRPPVVTSPIIIDEAVRPAYEPDVPITPPGSRTRHRHRAEHHRATRHREARRHRHPVEARMRHQKQAVERSEPRPARVVAPPTPKPSYDAARAAALGAFLDIPEGWEDGMAETAEDLTLDRTYLVRTACPGYTMDRQGPETAIGRLNPTFVHRLAAAHREASRAGIEVCIFSAYRPPAFGVGGFRDKFESAHSYGLAVDEGGLGGAGSSDAILFRKIAARHGIYSPYSVYSRAEYNHYQPTRARLVAEAAPLRRTITADGPVSLDRMGKVAEDIIAPVGLEPEVDTEPVRHRRHQRIARHEHHRTRYAQHHHRVRTASR